MHHDRRSNKLTAEKIEMLLKTKRAFDDKAALRFAELSGVPEALAREVLTRSADHTRDERDLAPAPRLRQERK